MKIILILDYEGLGKAGDLIDVKPGFARNKLFPKGFALRASKKNIAFIEEKKRLIETNMKREDASQQGLIDRLSKVEITIEAQVGEEEKMFGSVTVSDIQKSLEEKGIVVDRSTILLDSPIKSLGIFHVKIRLSKNNECDVKIYVIKSLS
ncbi:MAG: 50S ribosomal protein L9 [Candidatus Marinimicrobia bacterium]|nr:50S ribosomal protein L9 [Candidatus Neomarinimicrobiota bacterium]|tara:strand:+ start:508 stop:957 length:450 start_codon:yes stop_codon:yes gene_type:complete